MITTIIFDIGNVLMKFDYMPYVKNLLKDDHVIDKVNEAMWLTGYWNDLDRGIDCDQVFSKMVEAAPEYEEEIRLTLKHVDRCMGKADYAIPWICDLKEKGYRVLFLSNYSEFIMNSKPEVLDFLPYMDGGVFSCHVGMIKPDPAIYQKICDKYDLDPAECIFIDDNEDNVKAAREFGLNAILFTGYPETADRVPGTFS